MCNCKHREIKLADHTLGIPEFPGWTIYQYSCPHCFEALWESQPKERTLILWDGYPEESDITLPSIPDFITPLDWALALAYHASFSIPNADSEGNSTALPAIAILDFHSQRCPGSFAVNMCLALRKALPNVRFFHASDCYGNDFLSAVEFLMMVEPGDNQQRHPDRTKLNALRQAWLGYTARSGDHHDINNIVGVQILQKAYGVQASKEYPLVLKALRQVIQWFGFADDTQSDEPLELQTLKNCDLYLLDDRAEDGWLPILDKHLEKSSGSRSQLYYAMNPQTLLNELAGTQNIGSLTWKPFSSQEFSNESNFYAAKPRDRIYLIDLRLFISGRLEEDEFFRKLSDAVLNTSDPEIGDDVRSDAQKIAEVLNGLDGFGKITTQPERDYDRFLTLLARFFASKGKNYTLPIILFSSTGKRSVIEALKNYRNIITCAPKPQCLAGVSGELIHGFSQSLSEAFQQAKRILDANRVIRRIQELGEIYGNSHEQARTHKNDLTTNCGYTHIELYLDESRIGDEFSVGGCYAIFKAQDQKAAIAKANTFEDELVTNGLYFYKSNNIKPSGCNALDDPLHKRLDKIIEERKQIEIQRFNTAYQLCNSKPHQIGFLRLRKQVASMESADRTNWRVIDPDYWQLVRDILEVFLFESCRFAVGCDWGTDHLTISVYVGTRVLPFMTQDKYDKLISLKYSYGIQAFDPTNSLGPLRLSHTMQSDGILPLLIDLERYRGQLPNLVRCQAVRLIYQYDERGRPSESKTVNAVCHNCEAMFNATRNNANCEEFDIKPWLNLPYGCQNHDYRLDYRALIYAADWALSYPNTFVRKANGKLDFDDCVDDPAFKNWFEAGRALDAKERDFPLALCKAAEAMRDNPQIPNNSISKFIIDRLATSLKELTQDEFYGFVEELRNLKPSQHKPQSNLASALVPVIDGLPPKSFMKTASYLVSLKLETSDNTIIAHVQQLFIQEAQHLGLFLQPLDFYANPSCLGRLEMILNFQSDCDLQQKSTFRSMRQKLTISHGWKILDFKCIPVQRSQ